MGIINAECGKTFRIAYQGENKRQQVRFDLADIMGEFPGGTAVLAVLRNGDADPVPAAETAMDGTALIWTVTAWECALEGFLYAQVTYAAGETVAKTKVYRFDVKNSLVVNGAEPEDWQDLVGQLVEAADGVNSAISEAMDTLDEKVTAAETAQSAAEDAQEAAETARDEAVAAVGQYDDMTAEATGLAAGEEPTAVIDHTGDHPVLQLGIPKGEKGDTGATGQAGPAGPSGVDGFSPTAGVSKVGKIATITIVDKNGTTTASVSDGADGDPGDIIDDTAGAGDTDKTFSADKLTTMNSELLNQINGKQDAPESGAAAGKVLGLDSNLDPVWTDVSIDPEDITTAVDDWLDDHPEATTTVVDGSISYEKLDSELQESVNDIDDTAGTGDTDKTWSADKLSGTGLLKDVDSETVTEVLDNITWNDGYVYGGETYSSTSYGYITLPVQEGDKIEAFCPSVNYGMRWVDLMNGNSLQNELTNVWNFTVPANVDKVFVSVPNSIRNNANYIIGITHKVETEYYRLDIVEIDDAEETEETIYNDSDIEWTTGLLHSDGTVHTGGSFDNYHYAYFDVSENDEIRNENNVGISNVCTYYGSKYIAKGHDDILSFTVPAMVNKVAVTRGKTNVSGFVISHKIKSNRHVVTKEALSKNVEQTIQDALENNESAYVRPKNTTFFDLTNNLINPIETVDGWYVNQTDGSFSEGSAHTRTGYIPVEAGTKYVLMKNDGAKAFRYAFYNSQKTFISGAQMNGTDLLITSPNNAEFIALSLGNHLPETWMLKKYTDNFDFEPYDLAFVKPKHIAKLEDVVMNLPSKIYALVGYECNIYFENLVEHWDRYSWKVICNKGKQFERGYKITPVDANVGEYPLTIRLQNGEYITSRTSTLVITAADARNGESENVMILGDSTTNNGIAVTKLNANLAEDVYSITTIGTRGTSPNNHEGRSGWTFEKYFNPPTSGDTSQGVENPWYNPTSQTFDANYYFTQTGIAKPDWFFINLGINDVFDETTDDELQQEITKIKNYCDSMIASMNSASENTKIGICLTIPPNHSQDAFGKEYGCYQTRDRYKRNNALLVNSLIKEYDGRENEGIYIIPIYTNLDTVYNMGFETLPVNARNTTITYESPIANGGVHPVESGYWQIADVYTAFLKAQGST